MLSLYTTIVLFAITALLRVLVGYQPHSGQDNHHGQRAPVYGGDFEAQRHWMELTYQVPISEWYWYDLEYWGLDYPPLTAYVSWLCGYGSHCLVGPASVALSTSRGYEDPVHKAYMRATVLVFDLLCYGSAVYKLMVSATHLLPATTATALTSAPVAGIRPNASNDPNNAPPRIDVAVASAFLLVMIEPAIVLIDHGHFQYNTVALGLSLWSFYYMTRNSVHSSMHFCIVGSIFFCLALSFKQMTLYYAPVVFFYLLGRCFARGNKPFQGLSSVATLGVVVVTCFVLLWWPFVVYGPDGTTYADRAAHVLHRIIPLQRGLFEGKVSNLWCALSVKPFNIRRRIPERMQPIAALLATLLLILPCSYRLFQTGRGSQVETTTGSTRTRTSSRDWIYDRKQLLWGATNSALAFFLASFQVHEKSLLLALAPCSILFADDTTFFEWFSIVTVWTLWPLLQIDRLQTAYVCTTLIFISAMGIRHEVLGVGTDRVNGFFEQNFIVRWIPVGTYTLMGALHAAELLVVVPKHLPDLFPVLWSIIGCGLCCFAWLITCWHLFRKIERTPSTKQKFA